MGPLSQNRLEHEVFSERTLGRLIYMDNSNREVVVPFGPEQPVVTIGRATDCVIRSNRRSVSRHHAEFRYHNGQYEVVDLGSANGTYLIINENRQRIEGRLALTHSDEVWCGDFILYFEEDEEDYYEPLPYDVEVDSDPTYGDHNPIQRYDDGPASYQNPPMYDQGGYDQGGYEQGGYDDQESYPAEPLGYSEQGGYAEPAVPQPNWNHNPGAAPFSTSPPPPPPEPSYVSSPPNGAPHHAANTGGGFGAEPYNPSGPPERPSGSFGAEPYNPNSSGSFGPAEPVGRDLPSSPSGHPPESYGGASSAELEALQREIDELKGALEHSTSERAQVEQELVAERQRALDADTFAQENARLKQALDEARQSSNADEALKKQLEETNNQLKEREERIEAYRRRITQAEEEATRAARLREDLRSRERDIEQLHQEVDRQREEARLARDEARKARESAERARGSLQIAERAAQEGLDLKKELERHKRLLDEIERRNRDLTTEFTELETLSKELEQMLEQKTSEAESLKNLANNHEKRLGELSTDTSKFNQELKKTRVALDEALHKAERFEVLANQLEQELGALKQASSREIADLSERLDVSSRDNAVTIAKLTNQRDQLVEERDLLQARLEEVDPEMRALRSEIEGLKQRLRMEKRQARQEDSEELERAQLQNAELAARLDDATSHIEGLEARLATASSTIEELEARLATPPEPQIDLAEVEQLRNHNQSLRERLNSLEQHLDDVSSQATVDVPTLRQGASSHAAEARQQSVPCARQVLELLEALDRVVDAIARTDLGPLGTVDRIRLQSALRDTNPRQTLEEARQLLLESSNP